MEEEKKTNHALQPQNEEDFYNSCITGLNTAHFILR
jgi:hypothetical protein